MRQSLAWMRRLRFKHSIARTRCCRSPQGVPSATEVLDAVQVFQPYAEELLASGAGHLWYAAADRGLTAYTTPIAQLLDGAFSLGPSYHCNI